MLPAALAYAALLAADRGRATPGAAGHRGWRCPVGIAEADLRPVLLDFAASRTWSPSATASAASPPCCAAWPSRSPAASPRSRPASCWSTTAAACSARSTTEHLIGYGTAAETTVPLVESVASYMDKRRPGPDVTPEQLRARSWWTGPECFVLVDDYDLVATGPANPLLPLLDYLAQARDVGLHLVLTRRAGGAGRALFEPILQRLRELGYARPGACPATGTRAPLVGTVRPGPQPPGRGWLVTRREGTRLVQLARLDPP